MDDAQRWALRRLYHHMTDQEIAEYMGVRVETVKRYARKEKLHRRSAPAERHGEPWTDLEVLHLREWWPHEHGVRIAEWLGRKYDAVRRKASNLGLTKSAEFIAASRVKGAQQATLSQRLAPPGDEAASRIRIIQ